MKFLNALLEPETLLDLAELMTFLPAPVGPLLAAAFRFAAAMRKAGKTQLEIDAIVAGYSAEAQKLADDWHG